MIRLEGTFLRRAEIERLRRRKPDADFVESGRGDVVEIDEAPFGLKDDARAVGEFGLIDLQLDIAPFGVALEVRSAAA